MRLFMRSLPFISSLALSAVIAIASVLAIPPAPSTAQTPSQPTNLNRPRSRVGLGDVAALVYQQIPNLPRETQYIATKKTDQPTTLIHRLIRYHAYVKGRPVTLRLDWKLTLADYFDLNETIDAESYPDATKFTVNPLDGDKAAIASLSLAARQELIQVLIKNLNR